MEAEYYSVHYFPSGTTWIQSADGACKLHVGYWQKDGIDHSLLMHDRGLIEKYRFAEALCEMLNAISKDPTGFICRLYVRGMEIRETDVAFTDPYMGEIVLESRKTSPGGWGPVPIPSKVIKDLERGLARAIEFSKED